MTMMFEVEDLAVASPATVSRCGMVYMEPVSLGTKPIITSWIKQLPDNILKKTKIEVILYGLFSKYLEHAIDYVRHNAKEILKTVDNNLV